jgi:hypothetical protein
VFSGEDARFARNEGAAVDVTQRGDLAKSLKPLTAAPLGNALRQANDA